MKKVKIKIVWMVVLILNTISLNCMFSSLRNRASGLGRRSSTSGMSRESAVRLAAVQQQERFSAQASSSLPMRDTSTWSGWFQSGIDRLKRSQRTPEIASIRSEVSSSSPFGRGGQRRMYSTSATPESVSSVPPSFQPSLMSMVPWTSENKIEQLFKELYDGLEDRLIQTKHSNFLRASLPYLWHSDVRTFNSLVKKTGYNPLNRNFEGQPSFFAKMLKLFGGQTYTQNQHQSISSHGYINSDDATTISFFYKLGARWRPEEEAQLFFNQDNYKTSFKAVGNRINKFSFDNTLDDLLNYIYFIRQWKNFFESIGLNINDFMPGISHVRWDYISSFQYNCESLADKKTKNIPIQELLKKPYDNIFMQIRFIFGVAGANNIYDLVGIAQQAGFFKAAQHDYRRSSKASSSGKAIWDLLPNLTSSSSKEDIAKVFRRYSIDNHEDRLNVLVRNGEITQEDADQRKEKYKKITAAWNEYNDQLKQQRATE